MNQISGISWREACRRRAERSERRMAVVVVAMIALLGMCVTIAVVAR